MIAIFNQLAPIAIGFAVAAGGVQELVYARRRAQPLSLRRFAIVSLAFSSMLLIVMMLRPLSRGVTLSSIELLLLATRAGTVLVAGIMSGRAYR